MNVVQVRKFDNGQPIFKYQLDRFSSAAWYYYQTINCTKCFTEEEALVLSKSSSIMRPSKKMEHACL